MVLHVSSPREVRVGRQTTSPATFYVSTRTNSPVSLAEVRLLTIDTSSREFLSFYHVFSMSARYFGQNSTFLSSYRPQASVLSPIFWSNMIPVAFILYCAIKHPKRTSLYTVGIMYHVIHNLSTQESVLFPTFTQAIMTVPNASYLTWFALFIMQVRSQVNVMTSQCSKSHVHLTSGT